MSILKSWSWVAVGMALILAHGATRALEKIVPAELAKPSVCPPFHEFKGNACVPKPDEVAAPSEDNCRAAGFDLQGSGAAAKCVAGKQSAAAPECKPLAGYLAKVSGAGAGATCSYEAALPSSTLGDYLGDCFGIKARPPGTSLEPGNSYFVSAQKNLENEDRLLTLVPGRIQLFPFGCKATGGPQQAVTASALVEAGASRQGYAYGFLTMPYKYYPGLKSFEVNVPIGGYMGWRYGQAGSGTTVAVAATLSSVKADTVDPKTLDAAGKPTITGSANVTALSGAFGVMFDVLKSPRGKPFKAGVFAGRDIVSKDANINYRFNRKTWIAIQLGYDFTDN